MIIGPDAGVVISHSQKRPLNVPYVSPWSPIIPGIREKGGRMAWTILESNSELFIISVY